jgi:hypothetical protein
MDELDGNAYNLKVRLPTKRGEPENGLRPGKARPGDLSQSRGIGQTFMFVMPMIVEKFSQCYGFGDAETGQ